jgi:predicted metal-dependent hydrolase
MFEFVLRISDYDIPVAVVKGTRYRRCCMKVTDNGLRVTVPSFLSDSEWRRFIDKNRSWILKNYLKHTKLKNSIPELRNGSTIPFRGVSCPVEFSSSHDTVTFSGGKVFIPVNSNAVSRILMQWYAEQAVKLAGEIIEKWSREKIGQGIREFRLKNMRSRWGSCTSNGRITLNWRLVMAPETVFEYVYIHELAHFRVKSHNRIFWKIVEDAIPEFRSYRLWLRRNGYLLTNFPEPADRVFTLYVRKF